ncbi:MAG TPA: penicillin-binding protein 1B [Nevskiaceae bacterium]|nr:penicillin-binding protein 1B [Nevskiaceae bacterium]
MAVKHKSFRRFILTAALLVISVVLVIVAGYLMHLDREVQQRFAAVRWVLPAQVYAAPMEVYAGYDLSLAGLEAQLDRLGYSSVSALSGPGTYALGRGVLDVQTRPFTFWDGPQASMKIVVRAAGNTITSVTNLQTGARLPLVRFDPQLIGSIYPSHSGQDRILVRLDQVPPLLPEALVAVEDRDFYSNIGISFRGIARAALADVLAGHLVQGASTLTQQLVKNLFLTDRRTFSRKIKEALMSVLLERHVTKDQILEAYLNEVYLGQDGPRSVRGFGLASEFYFNKPLNELQAYQIALLVGMVKGPSYYNPRRHPKRALERRNLVLQIMQKAGYLTPQQLTEQTDEPLGINDHGTGAAVRYPAFIDLVNQQLKGQYNQQDLTLEGLRVFTTLDPRVQGQLDHHIVTGLAKIEKAHHLKPGTLQAAGVVTSVGNGQVLAMVGGRDVHFDGYNRALDIERGIGSMAKPFLYLTALEDPSRFNPATLLPNQPLAIKMPNGTVWKPHNYERYNYGPPVPMYMALAKSMNVPTVSLGMQVGVKPVVQTFAKAGFDKVPDLPSIFLGAINMSPFEVAQVYSTIAGGGFRTPLQAVRAVLTQDGKPLHRYTLKIQQTLPAGPVFLTTWLMENVVRFGTAAWAKSVLPAGTVVAGKTGTTNGLRDSWFTGFGANLLATIWVGRDDNDPTHLTGASGALRIWAPLMRDLHVQSLDTTAPPSVTEESIDPTSGLKAGPGCTNAVTMPFLVGYQPQQYAPCANTPKSPLPDWLRAIFQ